MFTINLSYKNYFKAKNEMRYIIIFILFNKLIFSVTDYENKKSQQCFKIIVSPSKTS